MGRIIKPSGKMAEYAATKKGGGVLLPRMKKVVLDEFSGPDEHWDGKGIRTIHASEMCKSDWCVRATYLRIKTGLHYEEGFNFVRENIFDEGNSIHDKWQQRMRKTGDLWGAWKCKICNHRVVGLEPPLTGCTYDCGHYWLYREVPLDCEDTHLIAGHADGAMLLANILAEIKSVGVGTVRIEAPNLTKKYYVETVSGKMVYDLDGLWKDLRRPFTSHVKQANVYLWMARELGLPFDTMVFLYEFKANQQVKEFSIKLSMTIMQPLLDKAAQVKYALEHDQDLPCEFGGCKDCAAMEERIRGDNPAAEHGHNAPVRPGIAGGSGQAGEAETGRRTVGRPARRRSSPAAEGDPAPARPRTDGAVPGVQLVGSVPGDPASSGRGRRTVRRRGSR